MIRDLENNRIKQRINPSLFQYFEKFYIYNNKIFQIIRITSVFKLDGGTYYDIKFRNIKSKKVNSTSIHKSKFLSRKLYHTIGKANNDLKQP